MTTNLKTKNNQNCQKIKLYGSPTTKELKKKHSFTGGKDRDGNPGEEDMQQGGRPGGQGSGWWTGRSHIHVQINQKEQLGSKTD